MHKHVNLTKLSDIYNSLFLMYFFFLSYSGFM